MWRHDRRNFMRYVVSDIHGEYGLFRALLERINFSGEDVMFVCGDIIDKGEESVRLAKYISERDNIRCIIGNHELAFLKFYHSILETSPQDFDGVLQQLRDYFPNDGHLLDWETVDWLDALPEYIEDEDFICVHAGIPIEDDGSLRPLTEVETESLVYDRRFKEPDVVHSSPRCVFFGHTQTDCICGENKILGYLRPGIIRPKSIRDYYKVHLDTGTWSSGTLGCLCIDTLKTVYVKKHGK